MEYELALELKNAGFPQDYDRNLFKLQYPEGMPWYDGYAGLSPEDGINVDDLEKRKVVGAYAPTLEELIEACGEEFVVLRKYALDWEAKGKILNNISKNTRGTRPDVAVARLWLALNKHD